MTLPPSIISNVNTAPTALGIPLLLALVTFQVECRMPPKFVIRGIERALYGPDKGFSPRLSMEQTLSRKEAYRGRRRRKRRPLTNYAHAYGFNKKPRSRPRRPPPPVQEYPEDLEDLGEEPGFSEERPIRTRPWSNHLYSASIRSREPPRARPPPPDLFPRYRGKKPRPQPIAGLTYFNREPERPEEFQDPRWNDYREEFPPRHPDWDLEDQSWEPERVRNQVRGDFSKFYGKNPPWRDNREIVRTQNFKNNPWHVRENLQSQQIPSYQIWSEEPNEQEDIEVQVKYPVWMENSKNEDWGDELFPGQRAKQKYQQDGRNGKQRPALNQDLEAHVIQPAKNKNKFRSGIGQSLRGQKQEINWELESPSQSQMSSDPLWEDPKPFETHWNDQKPGKNYQWSQKKVIVNNKDGQWDDPNNKDYNWSETSSTTDHWTEGTTSTSQAYPHWDKSQQFYHDRSLRQKAVAQPKMDTIEEEHDSSEHKISLTK